MTETPCAHPEGERQNLHHNGIPVELCRACEHTRGFKARVVPATGQWGEWMPGNFGWAAAPLFAVPFFPPGEMFTETATDQWRRENGVDPITGEPV